MCEECVTYLPVAIQIGCSGFGDSFGRVEDYASNNIQEIIFLGSSLMWKNSDVCGGRMELKILVRD